MSPLFKGMCSVLIGSSTLVGYAQQTRDDQKNSFLPPISTSGIEGAAFLDAGEGRSLSAYPMPTRIISVGDFPRYFMHVQPPDFAPQTTPIPSPQTRKPLKKHHRISGFDIGVMIATGLLLVILIPLVK